MWIALHVYRMCVLAIYSYCISIELYVYCVRVALYVYGRASYVHVDGMCVGGVWCVVCIVFVVRAWCTCVVVCMCVHLDLQSYCMCVVCVLWLGIWILCEWYLCRIGCACASRCIMCIVSVLYVYHSCSGSVLSVYCMCIVFASVLVLY